MLNNMDMKLINLLQRDCKLSSKDLGERIGLSTSATQRRISALKDKGIIKNEIAEIDYAKIGYGLTVLVDVTLINDNLEDINNFTESILNYPSITQLYFITGNTDYFLVFIGKDMEEYDAFIKSTLFPNKNVKSFSSKVVMKTIKNQLTIPVK